MKSLFLSTALAAGLGALALSPASAGALTTKAPMAVSPMTTTVDCRMVEKRVSRNGVTRITKSRECDNDRGGRRGFRNDDRRYGDRRDHRDRRDDRPGFNIRIGQ